MEAYTDFAGVYDTFMDDTPYEEWCAFLIEVLKEFHIEKELVLDLGCGTGTLTGMLASAGYDMIGVDSSGEMLNIALEKKESAGYGEELLYLCQDMREFELYGTVKAVISVCDSLNYLLEEEDLLETFQLVNNYLDPGGIFIFDFNTVYKYATVIGDTTIAENREDCSFIWENYYHEEQEINEYDLTVFVAGNRSSSATQSGREETEAAGTEDDGMERGEIVDDLQQEGWFRRFQEVHYQRGYRLEQMKALLAQAGMEFVEALDADTHRGVTAESERIYVVARKGAATAANQTVNLEDK